uniref:Uncharacterized protein n=1 Tax=Monodon monoceros TaxID=40151 RepID=A0A8C6F0B9_MONMO
MSAGPVSPGLFHCLKVSLEKGGPFSLFRRLGPNLIGVASSRAIFFAGYSNCEERLNGVFDLDSTWYMISVQDHYCFFCEIIKQKLLE